MKIFLKVLRGLLIVAPFAIAYFINNEFSDSGFFLFYIIASLLLIGAIYVTLTDNYGERVYGTDASRLRAYLESKLHIDLDNCNIYI